MQKTLKWIIILSLIFILLFGCNQRNNYEINPEGELGPGDYQFTFEHDGKERMYLVHVPESYTGAESVPLILGIHGGGGNAENGERTTLLTPKSDKEGFIIVYPAGTSNGLTNLLTWNTGNCCSYAMENNVDDVGYFNKLLNQMEEKFNIDKKKIYATGLSNGGMMSYLLGCEMSNRIAAIAPVAGAQNFDCAPSEPVSAIIFHGTEDHHVLYAGGTGTAQASANRVDKSVEYALNFWVQNNKCSSDADSEEFDDIIHKTYSGCNSGTDVELYTIVDGGHSWPGGKYGLLYGNVDSPTQTINATDLIWEFFKEHPKN